MYFSTALIFLLIILDVLVYCLQKQQGENDGEQKNSNRKRSVHEEEHGERTDLSSQCRIFSLAEIKLATHDFDDAFVIGKGGFGKVYKGKMDFGEGTDVAIKRLNLDSIQGPTEFWAEIKMLSKFRHTHIVSLLGYYQESGLREMILVYEYMSNGSLEDHLHKIRANGSNSSSLTWVQRLHICIGAARGLDYLHTGTGVKRRVIHRDVKSSNILLDENLEAKIADFGVSRFGPAYQSGATTNVYTDQIIGTFGYMDAEYFATHRLTRKSDVYAFGVVLFEVLCGRRALDFTLDEQQHSLAGWAKHCIKGGNIGRIIDPCLREQVPAKCLKEFGQTAYECLLSSSKDRPTMSKVVARLEFVLAWTLRSQQSYIDRKNIGRTTFIDKARSLLSTKASIGMSSNIKKHGNKNKEHATRVVDGGHITKRMLKRFTYSDLRIATRNFRPDTLLGEGGFGSVFKGWLDSITYEPRNVGVGIAVAVKKLDPESVQGLREWQTEVEVLGKYIHPNLVKLLGYCHEDMEFLLVYEYMERGSLEHHFFKRSAETLPWYTRIKILMEAGQGLVYLHMTENNVIFRDVKCSNILLDKDFNAKLSDFGLVKSGPVNGESHVSTCVAGTHGYAAPEYIATGHLYVKSDVYSFGVVMLEIITGLRVLDHNRPAREQNLVEWATPFLRDKKRFRRIMDPRLEHDYPSKGASKAADLILNCLELEPKNRPSIEEVVSCLQGISKIEKRPKQYNANTSHSVSLLKEKESSDLHRTKQGKRAWYSSTRLTGLRGLIGSKKDRNKT